MIKIENVSRRDVLRAGGIGGAFILGTTLIGCGDKSNGLTEVAATKDSALEPLNLFVSLNEDGKVQILCHRAEMGQQARTGLARVIADELEADWDKIVVVQTEGEAKYGDQNTDGSTTIRADFTRLRRIGASARSMLERAASQKWDVPLKECSAELHEVVHKPTGRRLGYGELASTAATLDPPAYEGEDIEAIVTNSYSLKEPDQWRYIGKAAASVDLDDMLVGNAIYGQDVSLPGMKIAVIARPPVLYGKITSADLDAAKNVPGVLHVLEMPIGENKGGFNPVGGIAVVAETTWAAIQGRNALSIEWDDGDNSDYDSATYRKELEASVASPQKVVRNKGDIDTAFQSAAQTITADYYVPHLAHAQMEPPAALAQFLDGNVEVWTSTQNPQQARLDLARIMEIDYANVRVNNALLGGGFGRKSKPDFVYEAALLARALNIPIKVIWTREDDIQHDYLHTVAAQRIEGSLDPDGNLTGWRQRVSFPSISSIFNPATEYGSAGELGLGFSDNPFAVPNLRLENGKAKGKIRIGWLRSVNNIQHAFATQSFAAELAHAAGRDPKDYLLELIGEDRIIDLAQEGLEVDYSNYNQSYDEHPIDTGRLKNVIRTAADKIGWRTDLPEGHGMGIAGHRSFLSYVATAVEVKVDGDGKLEIQNVWVACDCGVAVNPESVRAQMEGASVFALSNMFESAITASNGRVDQSNFHDYKLLRINNSPHQVNVEMIKSNAAPGGVGEPGTPPFAPALTNAIFAATGKRIRELPIGDQLSA
ncbi:xanthine dehydrogenase family protein molybdopterin-binding subunit [Hyphococcus lacteus]|uniref:Molybdopterin cofactor-binding domain-containing protein n=1 Tax=Hyphococcus lacteus TaxID=3143536 RepID=A0ABV3Z7G9_9PROT